MRLTVIGAAGRLGWRVVKEGARRGHQVIGLARDPQQLHEPGALSAIVRGDGRDPQAVSQAVSGADAVVVTVSGGLRKDPHQAAEVTGTVIAAMQSHDVDRLVITSAYPVVARDPKLVMWVLRMVFATPYADAIQAERLTTESELDWTVARLNRLTDHRPAGPPHVSTDLLDRLTGLSRADAATLLVDLAEDRNYARQVINIRGHDGS